MKKMVFVLVLLALLCISSVGATAFSMERKNATTGGYIAISSGDRVYRGDTVRFTPAGGSAWNWSFGDGMSGQSDVPEHPYIYGFPPVLMHNGYVILTVSLKTQDNVVTTKTINFTTLMAPIVTQVATIATMDESFAQNYTHALTGDAPAAPGWAGFNWTHGVVTTERVYESVLGVPIFLMIVFSIPFIMNWIISKDFVVSGIIGGFLGIYIIARLPANMQLLAVGFIVASVVAIIYSLMKEDD